MEFCKIIIAKTEIWFLFPEHNFIFLFLRTGTKNKVDTEKVLTAEEIAKLYEDSDPGA